MRRVLARRWWRGAASLGYDEHGNRVRKKVSGRTRAEVTEKLRKLHQQVDSGVVPDDKLTVRAFLDRWLTVNLPGSVAESTEDDYMDTVRLHPIPALARKSLAKLTVAAMTSCGRRNGRGLQLEQCPDHADGAVPRSRAGGSRGNRSTQLHVVSEVLGHASIAITKDVYGHLLEGDKRAAAESMTRALFGG